MFDQVTLHVEGFPALGAVECLGVVMSLHMSSQVGSVSKLLTTVSTAIRLLSSVRSHMSLQQPGTTESLPAHLALVVEVVSEDVHLQGRGAHVHLVADVAGLGCFCWESFVSLLVAGQVGAGGEILPALLTLELWLGDILVVIFRPAVSLVQRVYGESLDEMFRYRVRQGRSFWRSWRGGRGRRGRKRESGCCSQTEIQSLLWLRLRLDFEVVQVLRRTEDGREGREVGLVVSVVLQQLQGWQGPGLLLDPHLLLLTAGLGGGDCLPVLELLVSEEIHD